MQTDDLEDQVSHHTSLLDYRYYPVQTSYRHFTMPIRENGNCSKEVVEGGLLSKLPSSSSSKLPIDHVITSSDPPPSFRKVTDQSHQNGQSHQQSMDKVIPSPISLPVLKAPVQPYTNGHSNGHAHHAGLLSKHLSPLPILETIPPATWGVNQNVSWLYDQETRRLSVAKITTQHKTTFGDLLHFLGYTFGATTIVSLYMIIPLMILLNAVLPNTWNKLLIALGILAIVEFVICIILAKTSPRSKRKKENVLVQP